MAKTTPGWSSVEADRIIRQHRDTPGALLPVLHALQDHFGHVPPAAVGLIANALRLSQADVHGVLSFYHHFRTTPPGRQVLQICRAEACQAQGGRDLERHAKARLGIDYHQTSADGAVTLEPVYCLGNCACGPNIRIDDAIHGRVDSARFDALAATLVGETEGEVA